VIFLKKVVVEKLESSSQEFIEMILKNKKIKTIN
jgi:hypothetical protein